MTEISTLLSILNQALKDPIRLGDYIEQFQKIIWQGPHIDDSPAFDVLAELAYDLDYYEPNENEREKHGFIGEERAFLLIREALEAIATRAWEEEDQTEGQAHEASIHTNFIVDIDGNVTRDG